jgi:ABC-type sugar transport system permease subunit
MVRSSAGNLSLLTFARRHVFVTVFGLIAPVLIFVCFIGYPIVYTIVLSFYEWNGMSPTKKFVGLANYVQLFNDDYFYVALGNNLRWLMVALVFPVTLGFLIAYAMRARAVYFPAFLRTVVFFPVTMSLIGVGLMFLLILNPIFGAFDTLLRTVGLGFMVREWFGDYHIAIYTLAVVSGWAYTGLPMIFYFAGLGDVPKETFDAARIEGAGHLRMMTRVALPQLRPVTAVVVMLTLFESLKAFDLIAAMTKGAPFGRTNVLGYLVYLESFWNSRFGYGAALSVAILVLSIAIAALLLTTVLRRAFDV